MANKTKISIDSISAALVQPRAVAWLWRKYLPRGKIVVVDGDPGQGKSTLWADLVARVTTNGVMPDGSQGATGNVVVLSAEDTPEDTLIPRLEAVGADLSRVEIVRGISSTTGNRSKRAPLVLPTYLKELAAKILTLDAVLVVVDPLMAYLDERFNAISDQQVRRALAPVAELAQRTTATFLFIRHLNKQPGTSAVYRGGGSIGIVGAARAAFLVGTKLDPEQEEAQGRRIFAPSKVNLARTPSSLEFELVEVTTQSGFETNKVEWLGRSKTTANELVGYRQASEPQEPIEDQFLFVLWLLGGIANRGELYERVRGRNEEKKMAVDAMIESAAVDVVKGKRKSVNGNWRTIDLVALPAANAARANATRTKLHGLSEVRL